MTTALLLCCGDFEEIVLSSLVSSIIVDKGVEVDVEEETSCCIATSGGGGDIGDVTGDEPERGEEEGLKLWVL